MELLPVSLEQVREVRLEVLQPPSADATLYDGDAAADTLHVGAFVHGTLAAVATICREGEPNVWRLRGMATRRPWQGQGLGRRLAEHCLAHARTLGAGQVWCSARIEIVSFYRSLGFVAEGEPFTLPQYSEHRYLIMRVEVSSVGTSG